MYAPWVSPFLEALKRAGTTARACREVGISTASVYALKSSDGDFAAAFDAAMDDHIDTVEDELHRRAFGFEEPVVYQGQLTPVWERDAQGQVVTALRKVRGSDGVEREVYEAVQARNEDGSLKWLTVTKHSDTLLLAKVKAYRKRYATDRTELTGGDGGPIQMDESTRAARAAQLLYIAKQRKDAEAAGSEYA